MYLFFHFAKRSLGLLLSLSLSLGQAQLNDTSLADSDVSVRDGGLDSAFSNLSSLIPDAFRVNFRLKQGGVYFPDKYDCFEALLKCAERIAPHSWTVKVDSLDCTSSPKVGLKFTGYKPPKPTLETSSLLWTLQRILEWYDSQDKSGLSSWAELTFQVFSTPSVTIGVGQVISTPPRSSGPDAEVAIDMNTTQSTPTQSSVAAADDASQTLRGDGTSVSKIDITDEDVNIGISYIQGGRIICSDVTFYLILIRMLTYLSEAGSSGAVTSGQSFYYPDKDVSVTLSPTSTEAGQQILFTNGYAITALWQVGNLVRREPISKRFREIIVQVVAGVPGRGRRGSKIIGKMVFRKGRYGLEDFLKKADVGDEHPILVS